MPRFRPLYWLHADLAPSHRPAWQPRHSAMLVAAVAALSLFYLLTLRAGHQAGDFAMLVQHAVNLVEGRPYAATSYQPNPEDVGIGGLKAFPPGTPVLLAPVYAAFGLDFTAMKTLMVALFFGSVLILALTARHALPPAYVFVLVGFVGLQPYFWEIKDDVLSDIPLLFFALLSLVLIEALARTEARTRRRWGLGIGVGVCIFAATMMRTVGLTLVVSLLLYDLLRHRRLLPTAHFWGPTLIVAAGMTIQGVVLPIEAGGTYVQSFIDHFSDPVSAAVTAVDYGHRYLHGGFVNTLLANGYAPLLRYLAAALLLLLTAVGYAWRIRRQFTELEVFTAVYAGVMIIWPFYMIRYMLPVYVLMFFYMVVGLFQAQQRAPARFRPAFVALVVLAVLGSYALNYTTRDFRYVAQDVILAPSQELYDFLKTQTDEDAVLIARVPNVIALYTDRTSVPPFEPADGGPRFTEDEAAHAFDYFERMEADYVVTGPRGPRFHGEVLPLWNLVRDYPDHFERVFANDELEVYRITEAAP